MMGIIRSVFKQGSMQHKPVLKKYPTKEDLLKFAIPIKYTGKIHKSEISVVLKPINSFNIITGNENMASIWDLFRSAASLRKSVSEWSGFMCQITINVDVDGVHQVEFSPFIDLDPNSMSTVLTTLMLVSDQCKKHKIEPVVTFDQLLWLKAMMIKKKSSLPITILLENFHKQMSFLGSIGYVMKNSGILELLSTAYAVNSAKQMLEGKQYERAIRSHDLLTTPLKKIILLQVIVNNESFFQNILTKYDKLLEDGIGEESVSVITTDGDCLVSHSKYMNICNDLSSSYLNKLWILHIEMVDLLHMNLMAERSGNWSMYLHSLRLMLPYFTRTGHNSHTRSFYWFLQETSPLNPTVHEEFKKG